MKDRDWQKDGDLEVDGMASYKTLYILWIGSWEHSDI